MEKKVISFKGISNVLGDGLNEAGDMRVLLNMRHEGGELVSRSVPTEKDTAEAVLQALYHPQSGRWLELLPGGDLSVRYGEEYEDSIKYSGVKSFAIMGNIVIMNFADRVEYAIWEGDGYRILGSIPEIDDLLIIGIADSAELEKTEKYSLPDGSNNTVRRNTKVGAINKQLNAIYEERGFVDRAWFRVAFRLFDGTYIKASKITQVSWYGEGIQDEAPGMSNTTRKLWHLGENDNYIASVKYFKTNVRLNSYIAERLKGWENIITSVDVFTTGSIMSFGLVKEVEGSNVFDNYRTLTAEEFNVSVVNAEFCKMAEYTVNGGLRWEIENTSPSMLAVQTKLNEVSQDAYISEKSSVYNKLYHIFDFKKKLFNGYTLPAAVRGLGGGDTGISGGEYSIAVFIKTEDGEKVVEKNFVLPDRYLNLEYYSYPDSRAYKMIITDDSMSQYEIPLEPHPYRNEAYGVKVEAFSVGAERVPTLVTPGEGTVGKNYEVNNIENVKNVLKVSAVDNPFYFPTAQTYKFEGEIKGLASNAEAISPGQFGQFPLYVFTDTGIWAMQVDTSGQGAYTTQSPFSREVCSGAVCPVSGGVVFATDKGVMAISGGQVSDLSAVLDGFEMDYLTYSGGVWNAIFAKAGKELKNPAPIREYINGAVLAYNYLYNEIILSNRAKGYSYVYSLTNRMWSVIDTVFDLTTNKYPELVVFDSIREKMITVTNDKEWPLPVVAITRTFTLGSFDFKRLRQAALRCIFEGRLNFYLLGSNDGAEFKCITGKEVDANILDSSTYRDLITAMSRSKQYKYFAIAIAGKMRGRISMAELLVEDGFANNKLR